VKYAVIVSRARKNPNEILSEYPKRLEVVETHLLLGGCKTPRGPAWLDQH